MRERTELLGGTLTIRPGHDIDVAGDRPRRSTPGSGQGR
jgi:hypothetical protein